MGRRGLEWRTGSSTLSEKKRVLWVLVSIQEPILVLYGTLSQCESSEIEAVRPTKNP